MSREANALTPVHGNHTIEPPARSGTPAGAWHASGVEDTLAFLKVDPQSGLSPAEVEERLRQHGHNELVERGLKSPWRILWEQVTAPMMLVLLFAAGIKALFRDWRDTIAILAIVLLNALLGFFQEYRAERAMAALKRMASPLVRVRRGGRVEQVPAAELVPGDVVLLEAGSAVPAD